jgi:hypothetical protein
MELDFDYKEGCYLFNGTSFPEVVIHKTIYKLVTITFQEYGDYKPFGFRVFDLTNKIDVELLNEKYKRTMAEQDPDKSYDVNLGTIVEYDYLKLIFLRVIDKKILSFVLPRPLLFDYVKARDKYLVADSLDRVSGLQAEFNASWEQYFRIALESKEKIEWDIISPPIPLKSNVNENLLKDEFGNTFTDSITVYDFLNVIDTDTFNKIPNQEIKDEISKLIKKTLELAKENDVIGKEDPNRKPKQKLEKFYIECTFTKDGEQDTEVLEIEAPSEYEALEFAKKDFYDKHEGESNIDLLFTSAVKKPIAVVPKNETIEIAKTAEEIFQEGVDAKKNKKKKTQEELSKEIDEADAEDLLSLLNEI